jgi:hypothetical protein
MNYVLLIRKMLKKGMDYALFASAERAGRVPDSVPYRKFCFHVQAWGSGQSGLSPFSSLGA